MNHTHRLLCTLMMLFLSQILTGCWDRTEINDRAFVLSSAFDKESDGNVRYTALIPLSGQTGGPPGNSGSGGGGSKSYMIDSEVGSTFKEAQERLQMRLSRKMDVTHRRTIIIGEPLARYGIKELFDVIPHNAETRLSTYVIVAEGSGADLLGATPRIERFPSEAIRELTRSPVTIETSLKNFILGRSNREGDPFAVYMRRVPSQKSDPPSQEITLSGYALFKRDQLTRTIAGDEVAVFDLLRKKEQAIHLLTLPSNNAHQLSLQIHESHTNIEPLWQDDRLQFQLDIHVLARMQEDQFVFDLSKMEQTAQVEHLLNEHLHHILKKLLSQFVTAQIDPLQFGSLIHQKYPSLWKTKFEPIWPEPLQQADFQFNVTSKLTDVGLIYDSLLPKEEQ